MFDCNEVLEALKKHNSEEVSASWDDSMRIRVQDIREERSSGSTSAGGSLISLYPIPFKADADYSKTVESYYRRSYLLDRAASQRGKIHRKILTEIENNYTREILTAWEKCMSNKRGVYALVQDGNYPTVRLWYEKWDNGPEAIEIIIKLEGITFADTKGDSLTVLLNDRGSREIRIKREKDSDGGYQGGLVRIDCPTASMSNKHFQTTELQSVPRVKEMLEETVDWKSDFLKPIYKRNKGYDRDFGGPPTMSCRVELVIEKENKLYAKITAKAQELGGDKTTAEIREKKLIYTAPKGFRIFRLDNPTIASHSWVQRSQKSEPMEAPVKNIVEIIGDTHGDEAGISTGFVVDLSPIRILIEALK